MDPKMIRPAPRDDTLACDVGVVNDLSDDEDDNTVVTRIRCADEASPADVGEAPPLAGGHNPHADPSLSPGHGSHAEWYNHGTNDDLL